jgi:DNA-binding transcriptional MerR regulator
MGAAAEILGVTPSFLRALGDARLISPRRSGGGHRRYSRDELERAARARALVDDGMTLAAACRVVTLEDQVSGLEGQVSGLEDRLKRANRRLVALDRARPDPRDPHEVKGRARRADYDRAHEWAEGEGPVRRRGPRGRPSALRRPEA